jgi:hypothetical protein
MNNKNTTIKKPGAAVRQWVWVCTVAALLPGVGRSDVSDTVWDVTGVSRIDVTAIKAPGLIPGHTVDIFDDSYTFAPSGFKTIGVDDGNGGTTFIINDAYWTQKITKKQTQYTVKLDQVDALALENQFKETLKKNDPTIVIYQLKLLSGKLTGYELDNGIWGSERYEYKIDSELDGYHDVVRLVRSTQLAGYPQATPTPTPTPTPGGMKASASAVPVTDQKPARSAGFDAAAAAVLKHMRQRGTSAQ